MKTSMGGGLSLPSENRQADLGDEFCDQHGGQAQDAGIAETRPKHLADRDLEADRVSEIPGRKIHQPRRVADVKRLEVSVPLEPEVALLF